MSQTWPAKRRDRETGWDDLERTDSPATAEPILVPEPIGADEPQGRSWSAIFARLLLGAVALGWLGVSAWSFVDPAVGIRIAPILEIIIRLSAPLVLLVGLAILIMMISGRWDNEPAPDHAIGDELDEAAARTAQSAIRITEAHNQLLNQTKAYAAAADRSAGALLDAVNAMASRSDRLAQTTAASLATLAALDERMNAFDAQAPQIEARLVALTETLARLGIELGERSDTLETQLKGAAQAAQETRGQLIDASDSLASRLDGLRESTTAAGEELTNLSELSSARIDLTLERVKTVLNATEQRIEAQNDALAQMVERSRAAVDATARQSTERFLSHCGEIEALLDALDGRIEGQSRTSGAWLQATDEGIARLASQFDALERSATGQTERLGSAMMVLSGETRRLNDALVAGDQSSEQLIKRTEALLLALDSGVRELDESLPGAIGRVETRLAAMRQQISDGAPQIESLEAVAAAVVSRMEESDRLARAHAATLDDALGRSQVALSAQKAQIDALAEAIVKASDGMLRLGDRVGPQMVEALVRVRETADAAANRAREAIMAVIPQAAEQLGQASGNAVEQAVTASVKAQIERLAHVTDDAVKAAHGSADRLDQQIKALADSSDALERRLAAAGHQIDTQDRELLTRRSAELIEMLNNRAIDVAKWLNHDISQSEWSAYLKGDKSIFTRRALKMLSRSDVRAIHDLYTRDADFSEHVNRYVHDFEALLKSVLDARDGSALAVTMLSSDLGKLYVALAQAIERLKAN